MGAQKRADQEDAAKKQQVKQNKQHMKKMMDAEKANKAKALKKEKTAKATLKEKNDKAERRGKDESKTLLERAQKAADAGQANALAAANKQVAALKVAAQERDTKANTAEKAAKKKESD